MRRRAVVLLSGGLDSAVTLFWAKKKLYDCHCLAFDYGQRHTKELRSAKRLAARVGTALTIVKLRLPWKGSSLVDRREKLPSGRSLASIRSGIPSTYVPGRNTIFISIAASFAEAIRARAIFIGAHIEDSSGYPDCRPAYLAAFNAVIKKGTKLGIEKKLGLEFPLVKMTKSRIIRLGASLGVPFGYTWSCYRGARRPCGTCDSCILRAKGFREARIEDPAIG